MRKIKTSYIPGALDAMLEARHRRMEGAVRNLEEEIISGYFTKYYNMIPETISFYSSNKNDEKNKGELFKTLLCI